jgi:hypothetical protein
MTPGIRFLTAARRAEIHALEELARTGELVAAIGGLVHALQMERGLSNVHLASRGARAGAARGEQIVHSLAHERTVRARFDGLDTRTPGAVANGPRLFSRVAVALHLLDGLAETRRAVAALEPSPAQATAAYVRVVGALLAVVLHAVDSASDPAVSRLLVAVFHFLQGKEFAGQERAFGAAVFAAGATDAAQRAQWALLVEQQERCFETFARFADAAALAAWAVCEEPGGRAALERLRRQGADPPRDAAALGPAWFELCTGRIDAMQAVEAALVRTLRALCERRIAEARGELEDQHAILEALQAEARGGDAASAAALGPRLERSLLEMLQEQSQRLQAMGDELDAVRASLHERKVVERAKGLLMASRRIGEDEAYRLLRQTAMNQHRKLAEVAESVLAMEAFL